MNKKIVAVVQARLGSTRLPNKILRKLNGITLLEFLIQRLKRSKSISKIVIATTDKKTDDVLAGYAKKLGVGCFRGSEEDVLDRTYNAARQHGADVIVRITSDCPLNDPALIDSMVDEFLHADLDYLCNRKPPTYPDGFDIEVFSFKSLEKAWEEAKFRFEREHVTPYISEHEDIFRVKSISYPKDYSHLRLTVDYEEDFELVKQVYEALYGKNPMFTLEDILDFLNKNPALLKINAHYVRDEKYQRGKREEMENSGKA